MYFDILVSNKRRYGVHIREDARGIPVGFCHGILGRNKNRRNEEMIKEFFGSILCVTSMATCANVLPVTKEEAKDLSDSVEFYFNKFELEGHKYIIFKNKYEKGNSQIVHDPDCHCLKKGKG